MLHEEIKKLQARIVEHDKQRVKLEGDIRGAQQQLQQVKEDRSERISDLGKRIAYETAQRETAEKRLSKGEEEHRITTAERADLQKALANSERKVDRLKDRAASLQEAVAKYTEDLEATKRQQEKEHLEMEAQKTQLIEQQKKVEEMHRELVKKHQEEVSGHATTQNKLRSICNMLLEGKQGDLVDDDDDDDDDHHSPKKHRNHAKKWRHSHRSKSISNHFMNSTESSRQHEHRRSLIAYPHSPV